MTEIAYKKESGGNYMIIECPADFDSESYQMRILGEGDIAGLIKPEIEILDGKTSILYNISGLQSFSHVFESKKMGCADLYDFLSSLNVLSAEFEDHLLSLDGILFTPEAVFINRTRGTWHFCCYPPDTKSCLEKLREFSDELLSAIDYEDRDAVSIGFNLNKIVRNENFDISAVLAAAEFSEQTGAPSACAYSSNESALPIAEFFRGKAPEREREFDLRAERGFFSEGSLSRSGEPPGDSGMRRKANATFHDKARKYFTGKKFGEVFDDINSGKIFKKIRETEVYEEPRRAEEDPEKITAKSGKSGSFFSSYGAAGYAAAETGPKSVETPLSYAMESGAAKHVPREPESGAAEYVLREPESGAAEYVPRETESGAAKYVPRETESGAAKYVLSEPERSPGTGVQDEEDTLEQTRPLNIPRIFRRADEEGAPYSGTEIVHTLAGQKNAIGINIPVDHFPFVIGKDKSLADFRLNYPTVSKVHCKVFLSSEGEIMIEDLNSTNSTYVNEDRLEPYGTCPLKSGDAVRIADLWFLFL